MKPIAVLQFAERCPAGFFATWAREAGLTIEPIGVFAGDAVPVDSDAFAGICLLGGEMSVNDPLAWIPAVDTLVRHADRAAVPVIGHCLGGQLIARAFGARVDRNDVEEIGWGRVEVVDAELARDWVGEIDGFETFQWHNERFDLPAGAKPLLTGRYCRHQAYLLPSSGSPGKAIHLGMQCHVEVTPAIIEDWLANDAGDIVGSAASPSVQSGPAMRDAMVERADRMGLVSRRLYDRWASGLRV